MSTFRGGGDPTEGSIFASEAALQAAIDSCSDSADDSLASASSAAVSAGAAAASAAAALVSENAAAASEIATAADAVSTAADAVSTAADAVLTAADVVSCEDLYDSFDDRYLGAKTADPTLDNDGDALLTGALYFKTTATEGMKVYNGTTWAYTAGDVSSKVDITGDTMTGTLTHTQNDEGNSSTALTIDWTLGNKAKCTLTGSATLTFTAPASACNVILEVVQDATGSRVITWPAAVKWAGGVAPTLSTAASSIDVLSFYYNGTSYYGAAGLDYS